MATPAAPTHLVAVATSSLKPVPKIITTTLPAAVVGQAYTGTISATGGVQPYSWLVDSGQLPPGLTLKAFSPSSARITGSPTSTGNFSFAVLCMGALG